MIPDVGKRRYQEVAESLKMEMIDQDLSVGTRLRTERQIAEDFDVARSVVREAIIMLEIEGLVSVRKGSGTYIARKPDQAEKSGVARTDIGPFELLQARQLLESNIAAFAATMVTKADIMRMQEALDMEIQAIEMGKSDYNGDELFHRLLAEATQNGVLVDMVSEMWRLRKGNQIWDGLHARIFDESYRQDWLDDHQKILTAVNRKDPGKARDAMWNHLENVRNTLLTLSDVEDPKFDGELFKAPKVVKINK
ncbi:FCD domain-containing protein [Cohaesibacter celericrescens]|uniref:GntR family transcriptional regulator n=1 Tax=Cohaesibacter celericrescens TaxID=2067669 RepID=A0A2N5XTG6_9HYPH|nr:FCD domain-containing protein [Cohaesibacter celericrescens]PLW77789.1 GntR family transcriptional regulator [Cohaesibacter celericrescens]